MVAADGLYEISSTGGVVSRFAPQLDHGRPKCVCFDEPNSLLYISIIQGIYTAPVQTAGERRAARIFPIISLWALTQRDHTCLAPAAGIVGIDETEMRMLLPRIMRLRVVGVFGLVLRFAFD